MERNTDRRASHFAMTTPITIKLVAAAVGLICFCSLVVHGLCGIDRASLFRKLSTGREGHQTARSLASSPTAMKHSMLDVSLPTPSPFGTIIPASESMSKQKTHKGKNIRGRAGDEAPTAAPSLAPSTPSEKEQHSSIFSKVNRGALIGGLIGMSLSAILVAIVVPSLFCYRYYRRRQQRKIRHEKAIQKQQHPSKTAMRKEDVIKTTAKSPQKQPKPLGEYLEETDNSDEENAPHPYIKEIKVDGDAESDVQSDLTPSVFSALSANNNSQLAVWSFLNQSNTTCTTGVSSENAASSQEDSFKTTPLLSSAGHTSTRTTQVVSSLLYSIEQRDRQSVNQGDPEEEEDEDSLLPSQLPTTTSLCTPIVRSFSHHSRRIDAKANDENASFRYDDVRSDYAPEETSLPSMQVKAMATGNVSSPLFFT